MAPELIPEGAVAASVGNICAATSTLIKDEAILAKATATFEGAREKIETISEKLAAMSKRMEELSSRAKPAETITSEEHLHLAGAGGDWRKIGERASDRVVQQIHPKACVAAVGEMLTNGAIKQQELIDAMSGNWGKEILERWAAKGKFPENDIDWLATEIGWKTARVPNKNWKEGLEILLNDSRSWGAELRAPGGAHAVVVDGIGESGHLLVRDPLKATEYEMTVKDFLPIWSGVISPK